MTETFVPPLIDNIINHKIQAKVNNIISSKYINISNLVRQGICISLGACWKRLCACPLKLLIIDPWQYTLYFGLYNKVELGMDFIQGYFVIKNIFIRNTT